MPNDNQNNNVFSNPDELNKALNGETPANQDLTISPEKLGLIKKFLHNIKDNTKQLENLLAGYLANDVAIKQPVKALEPVSQETTTQNIVEGFFDGQNMLGPDGQAYPVPANYASKSKMVDGDKLKLIITERGNYLFKQIAPVERTRLSATLQLGADDNFYAVQGEKKWRLLGASVTYFKGEAGDEVVIIIPKVGQSNWAAVENIVRHSREGGNPDL